MRIVIVFSIVVVIVTLLVPSMSPCQESEGEEVVSGRVSVAGKYDSNVDLLSGDSAEDAAEDAEIEGAFITEMSALLLWKPPVAPSWRLGIELYGLTNLHVEAMGDSWYTARSNLSLGYDFGANTISLLNEGRYLSEPDDREFDNYRNTASLVYTRVFSGLWQARLGYENILHLYPESGFINYQANGGFVEVRNTWTPTFSTYYGYHFHYYQGSSDSGTDETPGSPEKSNRHTGEIGFESFFAGKDSLSGAYTFQADDSSRKGVVQIGEIRGEDQNLEPDAEFNFIKHKGMLLYSHKFNDWFTLSLYGELIHKTFPELDDEQEGHDRERTDILFLSSIWMTARLYDEWYAKPRYLYRMNQSNIDSEDFQDHIVYLGLEHRF
jgi:hypothetical protein